MQLRLVCLLLIQVGCSDVRRSTLQQAGPQPAVRVASGERTIYDPRVCDHANVPRVEARWRRLALREGWWASRMAYANGELFVFGYGDRDWSPHATRIDLSNPSNPRVQAFDAKALETPGRRSLPDVRCIDGELVFWGDSSRHHAWGKIFDPKTSTWRSMEVVGAPASSTSTTDGRVLFVIDADLDRELTGAIYDPKTNRWNAIASGPALGLRDVALEYVAGKLLVHGCRHAQPSCVIVPYDPARDTWEREIELPKELVEDKHLLVARPVAHAGALWLFASRYQSPVVETLRLDGKTWVRGPTISILENAEGVHVIGGRNEGYAFSSTWNEPSVPRFRQSRARLTAGMQSEPLARISDPRALPQADYPFLDEGDRLAVGGNLFTVTMVRANSAGAPERALWMLGPSQAPTPVEERPPPPVAAKGAADPRVADVRIEGYCPDAYGEYVPYAPPPQQPVGKPSYTLIFLEDAKRPIATVLLGHYQYSDIPECYLDRPLKPIATIAMGNTELASQIEKRTATALVGDFKRPLYSEECIHVIKCDDLNGNNACDPGEPSLNRVNDHSRYEFATVSKRAQFALTVASRNDRFCQSYNWYSRCCPDGWKLDKARNQCEYIWDYKQVQPARCP